MWCPKRTTKKPRAWPAQQQQVSAREQTLSDRLSYLEYELSKYMPIAVPLAIPVAAQIPMSRVVPFKTPKQNPALVNKGVTEPAGVNITRVKNGVKILQRCCLHTCK